MQNEKYFSHSWALLTRDKGWFKPLLVMAAASFVPVAGPLGNKGYAMEYARLTAWGVDASPKQKNVDVGKCIASGWRGFVVDLGVWVLAGLAIGIISTLFAFLPGAFGRFFSVLWSMISWVICVFLGVALFVAEIRAAIYEKISAGYRLGTIFEMIRRDFSGFLKVFLVNLACSAINVLVILGYLITVTPLLMPVFMRATSMRVGQYSNESAIWLLSTLSSVLLPLFIVSVIFSFVMSFVNNASRIIAMNAAGLWMRQFDVPNWGRSEEPLPASRPEAEAQQWQRQPRESDYRQPQQRQGASHMQQPQQQTHAQRQQAKQPQPQQPWPQQPQSQQPQVQQQPQAQQPWTPQEQSHAQQQPWSQSQQPYVAASVQVEHSEPSDPEEQLRPTEQAASSIPAASPSSEDLPASATDSPSTPEPVEMPQESTRQTEVPKPEETPKDTFWRSFAEDAPEVKKSSNDYIDPDDTASLKRIDVSVEENEAGVEE